MKYIHCPNCGTVNPPTNGYCEGCGMSLAAVAMNHAPMKIQKRKSNTMKVILIIAAIMAITAASGVFVYAHFFSEKTVDITSGFDDKVLELTGYNGEGQITAFDEDKAKQLQRYHDADEDVKLLLDSVEYTTNKDNATDLSNGDKVTITATFDQELAQEKKIKVINDEGGQVQETIKIENRLPEKKEEPKEESNNDYGSGYDNGYETGYDTGYNAASNSGYSNNYSNSGYSNSGYSNSNDYDETENDEAYNTVSSVYLTEDDISDFSLDKTQRWINYIYAKNGYEFRKTKSEKDYFEQFDWYNNRTYTTHSQKEAESNFSDIERHNNKLLAKRRNALR